MTGNNLQLSILWTWMSGMSTSDIRQYCLYLYCCYFNSTKISSKVLIYRQKKLNLSIFLYSKWYFKTSSLKVYVLLLKVIFKRKSVMMWPAINMTFQNHVLKDWRKQKHKLLTSNKNWRPFCSRLWKFSLKNKFLLYYIFYN